MTTHKQHTSIISIIKKDGTNEGWDWDKIRVAISKASERVNEELTEEDYKDVEDRIVDYYSDSMKTVDSVHTKDLHSVVIWALESHPKVQKAYQEYRDYKNTYAKAFETIKHDADTVLLLGDNENANFDSSLVSTKGSLIKGYLTKELYKQFYLSDAEKAAIKEGTIYIHDLRDMIFGSVNCCLFDIGNVLKGGFTMSNVKYTEPTSVLSALQVIGDITLVATAQQFGGFTLSEIDKALLPYCKKSIDKYMEVLGNEDHDMAYRLMLRELEQGFQSLELKLNTVPCSRGDFAFTTLTFGEWDSSKYTQDEQDILEDICMTLLATRMAGHGGKQVVFPKLVYLYSEEQHRFGEWEHRNVFKFALKCSSKCMYPDYLSIDSGYGTVSKLYREHGVITSPMGCRAYLSPWMDPETGKYVTIGRCNIGAVSLNLPLIYKLSKTCGSDFYAELEYNLELIRSFLKKRYDIVRHSKASTNPMAFTQGGFYKGNLNSEDEVGDLVDYMTASFGITGLDELTKLHSGCSLKEDQSFAKEVLAYINQYIKDIKEEDGYLYALYGTPAESLCGTQMTQYHEFCKKNKLIDEFEGREYYTNSFHLNVAEDVNPFEKQDLEVDLFHMVEGGHIQYVRLDNPENLDATKAMVERGMEYGFYQGVNFDAAYCEDCGEHSTNVVGLKCPHCGSGNLSVISRVCGYLGYSNINGKSRMNEAKQAEIRDRKSM